MRQVPPMLLAAAQDLCDLHARLSPRGPYRLSLFADQAEPRADWPPLVLAKSRKIDDLVRGVTCLLASDLPSAAWPVLTALWQAVRGVYLAQAPSGAQAPYFAFLEHELRQARGETGVVYRLFGEVLAVYLDLLCLVHPDAECRQYAARITELRRQLVQTGESSLDSAAGGTGGV